MITVLRHGRTASNASGLLLGRLDPPLDEVGEAQAAALAASVSGVDVVVCSPLLRTRQTAAAFGMEVVVDDRLIELDYGEWDGRPLTDVSAQDWQEWRASIDFAPPGGESLASLGGRVRDCCDDWSERARAEHVVFVTHVSPIKACVGWALGVDDAVSWRMFVAPGSISRIAIGPFGPSLHGFNDVPRPAGDP